MTKDEIVRMANESGFRFNVADPVIYAAHERFYNLAVENEREECAKMLERVNLAAFKDNINAQLWFGKLLMGLANAIRTRGFMVEAEHFQIIRTEPVTTTTPSTTSSSSNATDQHN